MAAKGGVGVDLDVSLVPTREAGMTPYEILLSESQERMLVVARPDRVRDIQAIAAKWELDATPIGHVTEDGLYRVRHGSRVVAEIPGTRLVGDCPVYTPEAKLSDAARARLSARPTVPHPDPAEALRRLLDAPSIASKRWVFEQYDSTVQASTAIGPGGDGAIVRIGDTRAALALATDGNARYVLLDPFEGGKAAVAEAARNVAATGAEPIGITNCLNFGNPEHPEVFYQFREACRGIAEACRVLETPVTGGNVSFYNESPTGSVDPTPVIGMVGLLDDVGRAMRPWFAAPGHSVILLGATRGHLGGSAYWAEVLGLVAGPPPPVDLEAERRLLALLVALSRRRLLASAHDLSNGGLAVAVAESCLGAPYAEQSLGADLDLREIQGSLSPAELLFGEDQGRALVSAAAERKPGVLALAREHGVFAAAIGTVGAPGARLRATLRDNEASWPVGELRSIYTAAIPRRMGTFQAQEAAD